MSNGFAPDRARSAALGLKPGRKFDLIFVIACVLVPSLSLGAALTLKARYGMAVPSTSTPLVLMQARDLLFELPDSLPAGLVRLRLVNDGTQPHGAVLTRLGGGRSDDDYRAGAVGGENVAGRGDDPGGPGLVMPGDSADVTVTLVPGHYVVASYTMSPAEAMRLQEGVTRAFDVPATPGGLSVSPPPSDVTIELTDRAVTVSSPIAAGTHWIHVTNLGTQEHGVQLARIQDGHTLAEATAWIEGDLQGPAPLRFEGGLVGIAAGHDGYLRRDFSPGDYVLLRLVPDRGNRKPRALHGMVYVVHVS